MIGRQRGAMREVFSSQYVSEVGFFKSVLDEAGIISFIRNENPPDPGAPAFYPTLCLVDDADYDRAVQLLEERRVSAGIQRPDWTCPSCHEVNPGNFEICWKCQAARPGG